MEILTRPPMRTQGRPINRAAYIQLLNELRNAPRTVLELVDRLGIPKRTIYRYIKKADREGYRVEKVGPNQDSPYTIKSRKALPRA